jgi:hypothetical protein
MDFILIQTRHSEHYINQSDYAFNDMKTKHNLFVPLQEINYKETNIMDTELY